MAIKVTASGLSLLRKCQWWARPDVKYETTKAGYAASLGHAFHYAAPYLLGGLPALDKAHPHDAPFTEVSLEAIAAKFEVNADELDALYNAALEMDVPAALNIPASGDSEYYEQAIAYDPANDGRAELISIPGPREYPQSERDLIFMTLDYIHADEDNRVIVMDWKTGWGRYLDPLDRNLQVLFGAAAAVKAIYGPFIVPNEVTVAIPHVNTGRPDLEVLTLTPLDLAAAEAEVRALVSHIPTAQPNPSVSACRWCPARRVCEAPRELYSTAVAEIGTELPAPPFHLTGPITSPDEAAARLKLYPLIAKVLEDETDRLKQYADETGGIPMGDGMVYRKAITPTEYVNLDDTAITYLRNELGPEASVALKLSASKTSIEDALKAKGLKGKAKTPVFEGILAALRAMGALNPGKPRVEYKALPAIKNAETVIGVSATEV